MTKENFLQAFCDIVEIDSVSDLSAPLNTIGMWDSLAMLNMLALYDDLNIPIEIDELEGCETVQDLLSKANLA